MSELPGSLRFFGEAFPDPSARGHTHWVKPLDQVVRDRIAPVLKVAGFQRRGRTFWLDNDHGDRAFVEVYSFRLGINDAEFSVGLAVQPRIWFDFLNRDGAAERTTSGLWSEALQGMNLAGGWAQWSFDLDDEVASRRLSSAVERAVPRLTHYLAPGNLLAYVRDPRERPTKLSTRSEIALTLLLASEGPSDELAARLVELEAQDPEMWPGFDTPGLVSFIRARLQAPRSAFPSSVEAVVGLGGGMVKTGSAVLARVECVDDIGWIGEAAGLEEIPSLGGPWFAATYDDEDPFWNRDENLRRLVAETGRPALVAICLDNDFLGVAGQSPDGARWSGVVDAAAAADDREEGLEEGYDRVVPEFPEPREAVAGAVAWASAAGLVPDPDELLRIFSVTEWSQPASAYWDELLAALGLGR
jgi:hypothetical protein